MKAVVSRGPGKFVLEIVEDPKLIEPTDVILKVKYSGICGTDLHTYRGHLKIPDGQVLGHEFTGTITEIGEEVTQFHVGDDVVSTFTIQCGKCWYCKHNKSGQCDITNTFGKPGLPGGQAEYVRIPFAENCLLKIDQQDMRYVLMADIFITGYFGVKKILDRLKGSLDISVLQLGLGPVGLCALHVMKFMGITDVTCIDNVESRLATAEAMGFKTFNFDNQMPTGDFEYILEVVGSTESLKSAYKYVKRDGFISSIGMTQDPLPFTGLDCYLKNINISFGRCHSWSLYKEAFEIFDQIKDEFADFIDKVITIDQVEEAYDLFDKHKVKKVVIEF